MQRLGVILCIATVWANSWKVKTQENTSFVPSRDIGNFIVNGEKATRTQFPWQVSIFVSDSNDVFFCGGALISDSWVLTAGHCVQGATNFRISLGSTVLKGDDSERVVLETTEFVRHEDYNQQTLANDVALIPLPDRVTFTETIQPITLSSDDVDADTTVTVSGWGYTSDSSTSTNNDLLYTTLVTISDRACADAYGFPITNGVLCAQGSGSTIHSTCEGDSGGPLVIDAGSSIPLHVGIVSFGHNDGCESGKPAGFTRTGYFRAWIRENTGI